ncbi:MAG TPA: toll/interleukin-1 receptor domain-containing protein [Pyrinomonadaceae bacterium]|nr:toll/interleukin-1 receptor domain-containing protein [Pyrinomonadaceae bacterium]
MPAFISHSMRDGGIFSALRAGLMGQNIPTWDPASMASGVSLAAQLREAINGCEVCVFLATKNSIESNWCMAEVGAFWGAGKRVIVFVADPEVDETKFPPQLKGDLWTDNFAQVANDVKKIILAADEKQKQG